MSGHWTFSLEPEDPQYESHWRLEDDTRVVKDPLFTMCAEDGFNVIKSRLIAGAMLTSPDWTKRFWVACDASLHGYGSVLAQMDEDGKLRPLHFDSGHFNETEQNRASVARESYATAVSSGHVESRQTACIMVSTIKEGMGGAKSDYLQNHTFKSPVTRTDTRS
eukprot:COSAG06_NODE_9859_length_1802_cov_16.537874_2_plen_164_part_00